MEKQTRSYDKIKKAFIVTVVTLSCAILIFGILFFSTSSALEAKTASLENLYQRSLYELTNNVNNMEVEVSKLMVSKDSASQQKILSNLKQQSSDAESSLSLLPVSSGTLKDTTNFMNKLNGYCSSLITYKDGEIDDEDYAVLWKIHASIEEIKEELNDFMDKVMRGYKITDNLGKEESNLDTSFSGFTNESINYPSLIYDGPFSDSTLEKNIKGLPQNEITEEEAERKVEQIFGDKITNLTYLDETQGRFDTYDFGVSANNKDYFVQITKRGGILLTMSSSVDGVEDANSTDVIDSETLSNGEGADSKAKECIQSALDFARSLGLENMECVWSASSENVCYVNLAYVDDGIIMYPDLIKVKVQINNTSVVGWEATSYCYNHVEREDLVATLNKDDARKLVSSNLSVDDVRLCVIPLDYVGETLAYEFSGKFDGFQYYLYIDAYTGSQVRVMRVIQTSEGTLVQ